MTRLIAVTTLRQGDAKDHIEAVRAEVFIDTALALRKERIPLVAIYTHCTDTYLRTMRSIGVVTVEQKTTGMGRIRRSAIKAGLSTFPRATHCLWLEPEKPDIVRFARPLVDKMVREAAVLGLFNRVLMTSYPQEQACGYLFCRAVASAFLHQDVDYAFGPFIATREGSSNLLSYHGEYGDRWECFFIPRLRTLMSDSRVSFLRIDFVNDPRMTKAESGDSTMILKRLEQLNNIVPSLVAEYKKLTSVEPLAVT